MAKQKFSAVVREPGFIDVPPKILTALSERKRLPVLATVKTHAYRTTITPMGGVYCLPMNRAVRSDAGVDFGDKVPVTLEVDTEPRVIDVPEDFARELAKRPSLEAMFNKFSYSHRKEYVRWITDAKREATRRNRIAKAIEMLRVGRKTPDSA